MKCWFLKRNASCFILCFCQGVNESLRNFVRTLVLSGRDLFVKSWCLEVKKVRPVKIMWLLLIPTSERKVAERTTCARRQAQVTSQLTCPFSLFLISFLWLFHMKLQSTVRSFLYNHLYTVHYSRSYTWCGLFFIPCRLKSNNNNNLIQFILIHKRIMV